jgi:Sec-independent protein secretion pathway component TatC
MTTASLKKNRRIAWFSLGVLGMAVAPSVDPVTTTLQAAPLFILFEGSIIACALLDRREAKKRLSPALET